MVYRWKEGSRFKADAQAVGEELLRISEMERDAKTVILFARKNKKSELYKCFEWDDEKAGEQYRLTQARTIMRMIVHEIETTGRGKTETIIVRTFESVKKSEDDKSMVYVQTVKALNDVEYREQIMNGLEETIIAAQITAQNYAHIVPSFKLTSKKLQEARETIRV
jgi:hypothetical protein